MKWSGGIIVLSLEYLISTDLRVVESFNMGYQETALIGDSVLIDKLTGIIEVLAVENYEYIPLRTYVFLQH